MESQSIAEMVEVTISVTQEDIDQGERYDCGKCPIALAVKRAVPQAGYVFVSDDEIGFELPGTNGTLVADTPAEAVEFIGNFDEGLTVRPFSFPARFQAPVPTIDETDLSPVATWESPL